MKQPKIGIVTVLYNSTTVLEGFFKSLEEQTYKDFILYAIDNLSPDDSLQKTRDLAAKASFQSVILPQQDNGGVAKGNNIGIKAALADGCDYILLANNDIEFDPKTIETLLESMHRNNAHMIVPKLFYYGTDLLWFGGGRFAHRYPTKHLGIKKKDAPRYNVPGPIDYAPTCFMIIDRTVFDKVGLMDERYFAYFDDSDFIWRAVKSNGMRLWYEPTAVVHHNMGTSTTGIKAFAFYLSTRNTAYFMNKYFPWYRRWFVYSYQIAIYIPKNIKHPSYPKFWKMVQYYREGARMAKKQD